MYRVKRFVVLGLVLVSASCARKTDTPQAAFTGADGEVKLLILDPGHFHAALVQKTSYPQVARDVYVYAPFGDEVGDYLRNIRSYNNRPDDPTQWRETVYYGDDYLERMTAEKRGNVMVVAGNNRKKTEYIKAALDNGMNVLADKPMAINGVGFELLKECFETADRKGLLLYDIMTERYEITSVLQRELAQIPELFGELEKGTPEDPAVIKESVHHFSKTVSGARLLRPAWFFDVDQQGEGIVDVATHLVDLIQWSCFPEQVIDYRSDIEMIDAGRWPTAVSPVQFEQVTGLGEYPGFLRKDVKAGTLQVYANGSISYRIKGVHAKVDVIWNFEAPEGAGDTHYSVMRGTKAELIIRQGAEQGYKPTLYVKPASGILPDDFDRALSVAVASLSQTYPGLSYEAAGGEGSRIVVPAEYAVGHEAHFGEVTARFLNYLADGKLPDWEVPNMISKYYVTTSALEIAKSKN